MKRGVLASLASLLLVAAPALAQHEHDMASMASMSPPPLFSDLGSWTHAVTATSEAQKYFDQGLRLY